MGVQAVRLLTWQSAAAAQRLASTGTLTGDGRRVDPHYRPAYREMARWMRERTSAPHARWPIWAWASGAPTAASVCPGPAHCRSFRGSKWCFAHWVIPPGEVQLDLAVPADRVLLSDFDTWHHALNYMYLPDENEMLRLEAAWESGGSLDSPECMSGWERRATAALGRFPNGVDPDLPDDLKDELLRSWERCVVPVDDLPARVAARKVTQATVFVVEAAWVRRFRVVEERPDGRVTVGAWQPGRALGSLAG